MRFFEFIFIISVFGSSFCIEQTSFGMKMTLDDSILNFVDSFNEVFAAVTYTELYDISEYINYVLLKSNLILTNIRVSNIKNLPKMTREDIKDEYNNNELILVGNKAKIEITADLPPSSPSSSLLITHRPKTHTQTHTHTHMNIYTHAQAQV